MPNKQVTDNRTCFHCKRWHWLPVIRLGKCDVDQRLYAGSCETCEPNQFTRREEKQQPTNTDDYVLCPECDAPCFPAEDLGRTVFEGDVVTCKKCGGEVHVVGVSPNNKLAPEKPKPNRTHGKYPACPSCGSPMAERVNGGLWCVLCGLKVPDPPRPNRTTGDQYEIECPACGETIRDLWDLGAGLFDGNGFQCDHCGQTLLIASVDMTVDIVLEAPKEEQTSNKGERPCKHI